MEKFCKEKGWQILKNSHCTCLYYYESDIKGYDGEIFQGCYECSEKCPRCHNPFDCEYYGEEGYDFTCHGCDESCDSCDIR